jgi:uroporphyrin-III C-methyltransferase
VSGKVFLVGAGPGDPGLITWRGLTALRSCDVVVFDRLVAPELLEEAPATAVRIYAGKAPGSESITQEQINELLIRHAAGGATVVRLKGGDPFVFGRGGEEAIALGDSGIEFEVVPGVTSATAVPAYAGIPVTHRGMASSFAVVTGRQAQGGPRWAELAHGVDTLVLMMGVARLRCTAESLIAAGRDPQEPAAIVEWGTTERQRTLMGDLASIADIAETAGVGSPATTVIGDVVLLRNEIAWAPVVRQSGAREESSRAGGARGGGAGTRAIP